MSLATAILQEQNHTTTENGMAAFNSTLDACLDFFFQAGGARAWSDQQIITLWEKARVENEQIAYKLLFWSRDIRGGAGERRFFRVILKHICESYYSRDIILFLKLIPYYGRWDDFEIILLSNNKKIKDIVLSLYKIAYDESRRRKKDKTKKHK